jgi:hypothetical protein
MDIAAGCEGEALGECPGPGRGGALRAVHIEGEADDELAGGGVGPEAVRRGGLDGGEEGGAAIAREGDLDDPGGGGNPGDGIAGGQSGPLVPDIKKIVSWNYIMIRLVKKLCLI